MIASVTISLMTNK